jgi:sugar/nucleoside kinase (ribokinase family)
VKKSDSSSRCGLLAAGNWIIDQVKIIDVYPQRDQLANIRSQSQGTGGSPYNVLIDLARLEAPFPLIGAGLVGDDDLGRIILEDCRRHRIDTRHLRSTPLAPTSYTDVMTEQSDGHRTFFHQSRRQCALERRRAGFQKDPRPHFSPGLFAAARRDGRARPKHGTKAAALLRQAQAAGMKTSVDVVSEDSDRFAGIVLPALRTRIIASSTKLRPARQPGSRSARRTAL